MAVFAAIAFTSFLLEDDYFVTFYERLGHFAYYFGSFNGRSANFNVTVGIKEEHAVKFYCVARFFVLAEKVNIQELAGFCLELLSLDFYNSVHFI